MNNLHDAVLLCDDLTRIYQEGPNQLEVLSGINLRIERGEMVAVVGASGSGKSTLLNLLGGLDSPTRGSVAVCGTRLDMLSEKQLCQLRNRSVGFIYQFHHLLPEFTALENVVLPLYYTNQPGWVAVMKGALCKSASFFNSHRMMRRYVTEAYIR